MNHLKAINRKAARIEEVTAPPAGRTWSRCSGRRSAAGGAHSGGLLAGVLSGMGSGSTGGTAGLCQPVERDLFDCHVGCYWPAQVPDQLNHAPDWTSKCAAAQKDWRKIDLIFP